MDVPAGVTQEEGNTGFSIHLLSAVLAFIFLARRIQPFVSLVDREVDFFCVLTIESFSTRWAFLFSFFSFSVRKIPLAGIELTSQRVRGYMVPLSYRGDRRLTATYLCANRMCGETDLRSGLMVGCIDLPRTSAGDPTISLNVIATGTANRPPFNTFPNTRLTIFVLTRLF